MIDASTEAPHVKGAEGTKKKDTQGNTFWAREDICQSIPKYPTKYPRFDALAMTSNPYLPPRASLEPAVAEWRPNPYWRFGNWLYGIAMLIFVFFLSRGGSLAPDFQTVVTLLLFLAPLAGYYVTVSVSTAQAHKLWRIAHLLLLCFMFWLAVDDVLGGNPTPAVGWFLISLNVLSLTSNEIFHRHRGRVPG